MSNDFDSLVRAFQDVLAGLRSAVSEAPCAVDDSTSVGDISDELGYFSSNYDDARGQVESEIDDLDSAIDDLQGVTVGGNSEDFNKFLEFFRKEVRGHKLYNDLSKEFQDFVNEFPTPTTV